MTSAYLATNKEQRAQFEDIFNEKYNGIPDVPIEEVPIFLENMKFFVGLKTLSRFAFHRNLKRRFHERFVQLTRTTAFRSEILGRKRE